MRNNHLTILLSVLMCMVGIASSAHDFELNGIYYKITSATDRAVAVTYKGDGPFSNTDRYKGNVSIPPTVLYNGKTYNVTSISNEAFEMCDGLTTLVIPNSVTSIGQFACYRCTGLVTVNIPADVTTIEQGAFYGCSSLASITIPKKVVSLGGSAFSGCI